MCVISLIVFTDKYLGHVWTFYTNGFSLHSNYIQIHNNNKDSSWEYKHYILSCPIIFNSNTKPRNTIELTMHTSYYCQEITLCYFNCSKEVPDSLLAKICFVACMFVNNQ